MMLQKECTSLLCGGEGLAVACDTVVLHKSPKGREAFVEG
jgi:hypothetical protein